MQIRAITPFTFVSVYFIPHCHLTHRYYEYADYSGFKPCVHSLRLLVNLLNFTKLNEFSLVLDLIDDQFNRPAGARTVLSACLLSCDWTFYKSIRAKDFCQLGVVGEKRSDSPWAEPGAGEVGF